MNFNIRQEEERDRNEVEELIRIAFLTVPQSDRNEHVLVRKLRKSPDFIPELSLVAEKDGQIIGHIFFSLATIATEGEEKPFKSLQLAPLAVLPEYQRQGIGGALIEEGHRIARQLGFTTALVVGHENYYPKYGYDLAENFRLQHQFEVPSINSMAIEFVPGSFPENGGMITIAPEFFS